MRDAMRLVLEGEGFAIDEAADGDTALEMVRADPPDLVFLDLNIPGVSGTDVLRALKADPATAAVSVIIVTATGEEGRERRDPPRRRRVLHEAVQSDRAAADSRAGVGATGVAGSVTRKVEPDTELRREVDAPPIASTSCFVM